MLPLHAPKSSDTSDVRSTRRSAIRRPARWGVALFIALLAMVVAIFPVLAAPSLPDVGGVSTNALCSQSMVSAEGLSCTGRTASANTMVNTVDWTAVCSFFSQIGLKQFENWHKCQNANPLALSWVTGTGSAALSSPAVDKSVLYWFP